MSTTLTHFSRRGRGNPKFSQWKRYYSGVKGAYGAARRAQSLIRGWRSRQSRRKRPMISKVRARLRKGGQVKRVGRRGLTNHSDLKRAYNHDSLSICVGQSTKMLNTTKAVAIAEEEIVDHISDYASQVITNNGTEPSEMIHGHYHAPGGAQGAGVYFGNDDLTSYSQIDYLKQVGLYHYTLTSPSPEVSNAPNDIIHTTSNQIYGLRSMFKVWRKDSISFTIKWRGMINSTHPLGTPKGYYRLITGSKERVSYKADGTEYAQSENPQLITHYENQFFSPKETLARKYGSATEEGTLSAGAFYNATDSLPTGAYYLFENGDASNEFTPKVGQQSFCYRNIRENPKGWKRIPAGNLIVKHTYGTQLHPTQENDIALDPILLFVFENTDAWQPTKQDIDLTLTATTAVGTSTPHQDGDIIPAIIADIETLHCFHFTRRATLNKPVIDIPDPSSYHPY